MSNDFAERFKIFDEIVQDAENLLSIARDSDLQRKAMARLADFAITLDDWKRVAVTQQNEDRANLVLAMECVTESLMAELRMWLLLKAEKPDEAWNELIEAQSKISYAVKAHRRFAGLEGHAEYLDAVEKLVFPKQIFLSSGLIVRSQICSICKMEYADCPHIVGRPYWGQFCFRHLTDVTATHVAIVTDPANKRCRVINFGAEGGTRSRMTWRVEQVDGNSHPSEDGLGVRSDCLILAKNDLVS
jgi:hypothetical protein